MKLLIVLPVFAAFFFALYKNLKIMKLQQEMCLKYNVRTRYNGYFKIQKMLQELDEEDLTHYFKTLKKCRCPQLYAFLFMVAYSVGLGLVLVKAG